ncbi:MAG TPA: M50 family metallopeptidase [Candidatus Bathyarchaeia archaeon]|nr:M50 family metallopeptidase [Candidatus Bathyarchaeia archaeon]
MVKKYFQYVYKIYIALAGLCGISMVILVHEFGHFIVAHLCGVVTPTFSIGFGPALYAHSFGSTVFQIAAIPLGGYVAMDPTTFALQPYFCKCIILLAGIIFNMIFAYLIFIIISRHKQTLEPIVLAVEENSPAANSNLQVGDEITLYNDMPATKETLEDIVRDIHESPGKDITLTFMRNNQKNTVSLTLANDSPLYGKNIGWLGVSWKKQVVHRKWTDAIKDGIGMAHAVLQRLGQFPAALWNKDKNAGFVGPIGIISMTGKSLVIGGLRFFFVMIALLNINVALFNILPIPFLDGGQIVVYTLQALLHINPALAQFILLFILVTLFWFIFFTYKKQRVLKKK